MGTGTIRFCLIDTPDRNVERIAKWILYSQTSPKVGQAEKDDPAEVAKTGFDAMMQGEGDVVSGWKNKLQTAMANVTPASMLAEQHRKKAEPGSGKK
jgi:hypothetical protein